MQALKDIVDIWWIQLFHQKIYERTRWWISHTVSEILCRENSLGVYDKIQMMSNIQKVEFDFMVIEMFLKSYNQWHEDVIYNINIEPHTFISVWFLQRIHTLCKEYKFKDFDKLALEITENGAFNQEETERLNQIISNLRSSWILVGIDDFPNENNNNELLDMICDIDFIKIDKSFALQLINSHISEEAFLIKIEKLVSDIQKRKWKIPIIIEGIEDKYLHLLVDHNFWEDIVFFQGYHFHKPQLLCTS